VYITKKKIDFTEDNLYRISNKKKRMWHAGYLNSSACKEYAYVLKQ
jgi:hypothetical protein